MKAKPSLGDVFEIRCSDEWGYFSYAGNHPWLGDAILLVPRLYLERQRSWKDVFAQKGYYAFYALDAALKNKRIELVGSVPNPSPPVSKMVRRVAEMDDNGRVRSWIITDGTMRIPRKDSELSNDDRLLPIGAVWRHDLLCERLQSHWRPDAWVE